MHPFKEQILCTWESSLHVKEEEISDLEEEGEEEEEKEEEEEEEEVPFQGHSVKLEDEYEEEIRVKSEPEDEVVPVPVTHEAKKEEINELEEEKEDAVPFKSRFEDEEVVFVKIVCNYCEKEFKCKRAWGGHVKKHYKEMRASTEARKSQRIKRDFSSSSTSIFRRITRSISKKIKVEFDDDNDDDDKFVDLSKFLSSSGWKVKKKRGSNEMIKITPELVESLKGFGFAPSRARSRRRHHHPQRFVRCDVYGGVTSSPMDAEAEKVAELYPPKRVCFDFDLNEPPPM